MKRNVISLGVLLASASTLGACRVGDVAGNASRNLIGGGPVSDIVASVVQGIAETYEQMNIRLSPEQEHFLGRGVAAYAIAEYGLDPDEASQAYVRRIGAALAATSGRVRATHGGWHFFVLASHKPNGVSGPGGYVGITRGALDLARTEDEVAGILAHEMAHVSLSHGEQAIRASNTWKTGFGALGRTLASGSSGGVAGSGGQFADRMYDLFKDSAEGFVKTLFDTGYGREFELAADVWGTRILYDAGYDAASISTYLQAMPGRVAPAWAAHPEAADRVAALAPIVAQWGGSFDGGVGRQLRLARFRKTLGR